eukprot:31176-Pelagococcus_subviridis.AAC.23
MDVSRAHPPNVLTRAVNAHASTSFFTLSSTGFGGSICVARPPSGANGTKNDTVKLLSQNGPSPGTTRTRTGAVISIFSLFAFAPDMYPNKRSNPALTAASYVSPVTVVVVHFNSPGYFLTSYASVVFTTSKAGQSMPWQKAGASDASTEATSEVSAAFKTRAEEEGRAHASASNARRTTAARAMSPVAVRRGVAGDARAHPLSLSSLPSSVVASARSA